MYSNDHSSIMACSGYCRANRQGFRLETEIKHSVYLNLKDQFPTQDV